MTRRNIISIAVAAALLLGACHHKKTLPEGIMDTSQLIEFLTEAYLLEGYFAIESNHTYDTVTPEVLRAYDDMLRKYGISRAVVDSSLAYYAEQPDMYAKINDAVLRRLDDETKGFSETEKPKGFIIKLNK